MTSVLVCSSPDTSPNICCYFRSEVMQNQANYVLCLRSMMSISENIAAAEQYLYRIPSGLPCFPPHAQPSFTPAWETPNELQLSAVCEMSTQVFWRWKFGKSQPRWTWEPLAPLFSSNMAFYEDASHQVKCSRRKDDFPESYETRRRNMTMRL